MLASRVMVPRLTPVLEGKVALVTGAASGIGASIVARLAADGASVLAVDRDEAGLEKLGDAVSDIKPLVCDLSDLGAVDALPAFDPERFSLILRVMLEAPFRLTRRALPHMYASGWGRVVHISSAHGHRASPFKSAYVAAKHGLEWLSKVIALEAAAHGVTSNCISPGYVRTPLVESQIAEQARVHGITEDAVLEQVLLARAAVKRLVEPDEVAELAAVLYGPASASITGSSLSVDGGWTAG